MGNTLGYKMADKAFLVLKNDEHSIRERYLTMKCDRTTHWLVIVFGDAFLGSDILGTVAFEETTLEIIKIRIEKIQ